MAGPAPATTRNRDLERLVLGAPEDPGGYLVYADWLTSCGDPRGELVTIQHALSTTEASDRKSAPGRALAKREAELLRQNERFVPGVSAEMVHLTWRWGFVDSVRLSNEDDWMDDSVDVRGIVERVLAAPAVAALRELRIGVMRWEHVSEDVPAILEIVGRSDVAKQIRRMWIGPERGDEVDTGMYDPGELDGISRHFSGLESLTVHGHGFTLGAMNLPELRELSIESCGLSRENLRSVIEGRWPGLERLSIWFGSANYGAQCGVRDLEALLDGEAFPNLSHLGLMNAEMADDLCEALPSSKILKRLASLDLSMGTMSERGARAIVDAKSAFSHLATLNVDENFLATKDLTALRRLGPAIVSKRQKEDDVSIPGEIHRYVSIAE